MLPHSFTMIATIVIIVVQTFVVVSSAPEADKISTLPGQPQVTFQQYSGYITVDESQQRALFYYFVEAEQDPASKPLVLWLNGGPGCSSVGVGAFGEQGPFQPGDYNVLLKNDYSWNKGVYKQVFNEVGRYIDAYDVTLDVCLSSANQQAYVLNQLQETEKIDVCVGDKIITYLNRKDVQEALHAELVGVSKWSTCSTVLRYDYQNLEIPTISILGSLVKYGIRVLVYSGDQDSVIPLIGSRSLVSDLAKEIGLNTTVAYRAWFEGEQVAGWTQVYGDILSYATIRGASHEAPFTQPQRSLVLFEAFLEGKPLPNIE
ncbi:hypothetical protein RJT34_21831 [Clitoria ternatea]|uniref:Serine carboxypeptidase-like 45 n=1 Tax=Clitoria ternatea TaxID=43366 RepID=A0AAN9P5Y7_CLITE